MMAFFPIFWIAGSEDKSDFIDFALTIIGAFFGIYFFQSIVLIISKRESKEFTEVFSFNTRKSLFPMRLQRLIFARRLSSHEKRIILSFTSIISHPCFSISFFASDSTHPIVVRAYFSIFSFL